MTEIQHTDSEDKDKKRPWWKRILFFLGRIVRRVVVWTFLTLVIASLSIVIMSQTESFRRWAAPHIQTLINDQLDGKIEFSDFEIDIFNGLVFHDVRVLAAGDTVLASQRITLGYDLERLFTNEIYVTNLTIETPRIKILRSLDSVWNVTKIAKPSTDTTPANPFTWKIHAYDIAIKGGTITVYDSTSELTNSNAIDFSHLHLWNFNIALSADASIDKKDFELQLHSLSFEEAKGLSLKELSCKVLLDKSRMDLSNLKYITQDTRLELQAKADSLNIFEGDVGENLKRAKLQLELNADSLNTKDIIRFLPDAGVLGTYKVAIEASGSLSKIAIKKLLVESPFSKLSATGKLLHLDNPEKLSFQANVDKSYINYDELQTNAQSLYLPKLDFLGTVRMHKASINALPSDSIAIYANATTASGKVDGFLTLFMRDTLAYRGNLFVENINLSKLVHNSTLESSINAHVDIKGQGIMLNELEAFASIESLNSTIAGKHWSKAYFSGGSHSQGIVNIDSLMIDLTEDKLEPDSLAFDPFALKSPPQIMNASGMIDLRSMKNPRYKLSGNFEHFPLAKMADMSSLPRTVTANFLLNGSGFHPDSLEGKYHFNFKELTFPDRSFMPWKLDLDISRNYLTTERLIEIRSPIVSGKIEGLFTIDDLSKECISQGEYIADFLQKKLPVLTVSSSRPTKPNTTKLKSFTHPVKPINVRFDLDILDISPVNVLLGKDLSIDTRAKLRGSIVANMNSSTTDISECTFDKSRVITGGTSIISDKLETSLKVNIQHNGGESVLQNFQFSSVCDSTLTINETYLYRPTAKLNYTNGTMALSASGVLDNEYSGNVVGAITFQDTVARFTIDSLSVGYGGMNWQSHKTASGSFTPHGIEITKFELRRKNAERIELSGLISNEKFKDLSLKLHELPMREISKFKFIDEDTKQLLKTLEGEVVDLAIGLNGTYQKPIITCTGQFDNLSYNGVTIGNQTIELKYVDSMITGTIDIVNPKVTGNPKVLQIGIEQLPLNCAFTDIAHRMSKTEPLIITGRASKLSMGIIAPFVPGISKLQGLVDAEITVEGIAPNIHYGGKAALTNANFVVQSTNIKYYADGQISLKNNEIDIEKIALKNDEVRDLRNGLADITGRILLKDFNIDSLDIYIRSRKILLLSSASAATSPTLYGKFVISTGREPLHFFGTLQKPFLRGDVNIEDASLTFPPDKQLKVSASTFRYSVDSTKGRMTILITRDTISDTIPIVPHTSVLSSAIETEKEKADKKRRGPGLNELIDYDVFVKIPGNFNLKMILGQFDQLEANIGPKDRTIPLHFVQPPLSKPKLYGDIIIKEGSKYKFFKVFDASGSLQFNTGAIDNPQLNIFAKYKGQRDKDNRRQDYVVNLSISGSKNLPILGISYQIDGMDAAGDSAKVRSDAILMLLLGKTQDELRPGSGVGGQLNLTNELSSGASGVVSSQLSSLIQGTGVFTDAQIDFVGGVQDLSQARLNISGQLFGNVSWRIGGTLGDVTANSQFSVDIPLNILGDYELLNNFILQLTKTINANATTNRQQKDWEIKPGFRYSF